MMLRTGDLIDYPGQPASRIRILWISEGSASVVTIDVDEPKANPTFTPMQQLLDDLTSDRCALLLEDPYQTYAVDSALKERHRAIRDRAWRLIEPLVCAQPDIFVAHRRAKLIRAAIEKARKKGIRLTTRSVYIYLRRFWQRGLTSNALLPDYARCGAKGKTRSASETKRGRPRRYGVEPGINITDEIRQIFRVSVVRCYANDKNRKWTLMDVYKQVIADFFCERIIDPETGCVIHAPNTRSQESGGIPTFVQFQYWADQDHFRLDIKRKRMGSKAYDKDCRALLGTSNAEVKGPGDRYQIDATIADVYLVSRINRAWIIGRPVVYVVIDVFSRMITGLYIGLEGPSWVGAMMALANTAESKVDYCRRFDITIKYEDWPCNFLPGTLLADRGELESAMTDALTNNFNVTLENASPYRADWKGIVEQRFRLLPSKFKKFVPGYIEPDFRQRGGTDYRLDAVLDLDDFTRVVIECVLHYNNHHEIDRYDRDIGLVADEIPAIPRELWEWGIRNRSGALRKFPQDSVRFSLMPADKAMVTEFGIRYRGNFYTCPRALEERWFEQARQKKRWAVAISYDPRDLDRIYLHDDQDPLKFQPCTLTDRSRAFHHLSLAEVEQQQSREKHQKADRQGTAILKDADTNAAIQKHVEAARNKPLTPTEESAAARTGAIRQNRANEKALNRESETFRLGHDDSHANPSGAEVLDFPSPNAGSTDYSPLRLDELLDGDDDHEKA